MQQRKWRTAAGIVVLLLMAGVAVRVVPPYITNLRLQRALERVVQQAAASGRTDELLSVDVLNEAARLGVPLRGNQVHIRRAAGRIEVEALYVVPLQLPAYAVDLHFRPRARVP